MSDSSELKNALSAIKRASDYEIFDLVNTYQPKSISVDYEVHLGNQNDGVSELIAESDAGAYEIGYYYGQAKKKSIVNISTMIGCPKKCKFCELGARKFTRNLTEEEMVEQVIVMLQRVSNRSGVNVNALHKVNLAKSGEPLLNPRLIEGLELISNFGYSFKVSTVVPSSGPVKQNFHNLASFASSYHQPVQLQFSLISTNNNYRELTAGGKVEDLEGIENLAKTWHEKVPNARKLNLSIILSNEVPVDVRDVLGIIDPEKSVIRIRPYVTTNHGISNGLTVASNRTEDIVCSFCEAGFDVSVEGEPTPTEWKYSLSSNSSLERYYQQISK